MAFRCQETYKDPGRFSTFLRIFSGVSNPKEVEDILNEEFVPEKEAELLKRRRAKKLHETGACGGAGAPLRLFGDGIKFDNSYLNQPLEIRDPKFDFLKEPVVVNSRFKLRDELSFDLAAVNRLKESQVQPVGPAHDLQWLESKLQVGGTELMA